MTPDSRRLAILTAREIEELYGLPRFTDEDRLLYFDLSAPEREALALGTVHPSTAMHLALQIGYFNSEAAIFLLRSGRCP
jgi:hypothetical protein